MVNFICFVVTLCISTKCIYVLSVKDTCNGWDGRNEHIMGGRRKNDVDEMPSGVLSKGNLLKQGYNHTPNIEEMLLAFV